MAPGAGTVEQVDLMNVYVSKLAFDYVGMKVYTLNVSSFKVCWIKLLVECRHKPIFSRSYASMASDCFAYFPEV